jgi:hypothetical protein
MSMLDLISKLKKVGSSDDLKQVQVVCHIVSLECDGYGNCRGCYPPAPPVDL